MTETINKSEPSFLDQRYKEIQDSLNSHGNLPLLKVLGEYPFPVYRATVDRFNYVISNLPENVRKSPGVSWKRFGAKINGIFSEVGVGIADTMFDVATVPINLFFPSLRHPVFKTTIFNLYSPSAVTGKNGELFFTPMGQQQMMQHSS